MEVTVATPKVVSFEELYNNYFGGLCQPAPAQEEAESG